MLTIKTTYIRMKNIIKFLFILLVLVTGCKRSEVDLTFGETPDVRMSAAQRAFKEQLVAATYGWKVSNSTLLKGTFGHYMDFDAEGNSDRVRMISDINSKTISEVKASAYRVKLVNAPILSFETYNYIHLLGDPDPNIVGGTVGVGFKGDIEFEFERATADSIFLIGRKFNTRMILTRATKEEQTAYLNGGYLANVNTIKEVFANNLISLFDIQETTYQISANANTKTVEVMSVVDGEIKLQAASFYYSIDGMEMPEGLPVGNDIANKLVLKNNKLYARLHTGTEVEIRGSSTALLPLNDLMGYAYKGLNLPFNTRLPGTNDVGYDLQKQLSSLVGFYPASYDKAEVNLNWNPTSRQLVLEGLLFKNATITPTRFRYDFDYDRDSEWYTLSNGIKTDVGYASTYLNKLDAFLRTNRFRLDYYFEGGSAYGRITSEDAKTVMTFLLY